MMFRKLFHTLKPGSPFRPKRQVQRRQPARLSIEALEERVVLSTLWVGDATVWEGNAGATTAAVVVSLSAPARKTISVNFASTDGTAKAGSDYDTATGKLVFARGETNKTILIPVRGDRLGELDESFFVTLSGARGPNAKIGNGRGIVTIADDEPRIFMGGVTAYEGDSGTTSLAIDVNLGLPYQDWDPYHFWDPYNESYSNAYDEAVTVSFASQDGTAVAGVDYLATSGTLTFAPGETTKWIDLAVCGDRLVEGAENFFVNLSAAQNAIAEGHHNITLVDNEPAISILDGIISGEATFTFTFNVYLSNRYDESVTVNFATADGTAIAGVDYVATSGTLTFAPGEYFKAITVQILLIDLTTDMPEKYFYVRLSDPSTNAYIADEWAVGQFAGETVYYHTGDY